MPRDGRPLEKRSASELGTVCRSPVATKEPPRHPESEANVVPARTPALRNPSDVFTAFETTGIRNIESYTNVSPSIYYIAKLQGLFNWLLRTSFVKNFARKMVDNQPPGLNDSKREKSTSIVWGEVTNDNGQKVEARLFCPDAYSLTAFTCLLITQKILNEAFKTGYQTPAAVYGADLIMEIAGVRRVVGPQ